MVTDKQEKRLAAYKKMLLADIEEQLPDEAYAVYCKIKGYLQAAVDMGQINQQEMDELVKKYAL